MPNSFLQEALYHQVLRVSSVSLEVISGWKPDKKSSASLDLRRVWRGKKSEMNSSQFHLPRGPADVYQGKTARGRRPFRWQSLWLVSFTVSPGPRAFGLDAVVSCCAWSAYTCLCDVALPAAFQHSRPNKVGLPIVEQQKRI